MTVAVLAAVVAWFLVRELLRLSPVVQREDHRVAVVVTVTNHAAQRAAERFDASLTAFDVAADVALAVRDGLTGSSVTKPNGRNTMKSNAGSFAWTPDHQRVYAIRERGNTIAVITALPGHQWPPDTTVGIAFKAAKEAL